MKRTLSSIATLLLVSGCAVAPEQRVDRMFAEYAGARTPGAAVRVIQDGEVVLTRTYGVANVETGEPITAKTNFRLASISKQFTATAILMLVEQGRLTLDTVLLNVFQDFPDYGDDITIEHLLQHRSGIPDYEPLVPADATVQVRDADVLKLMMEADAGYFAPGSAYRYSNSGYAVLAMIVDEMNRLSFAEFLSERIFKPAGMSASVAFEDGISTVPARALGYTVTSDGVLLSDQSAYSAVLGDGGVYSSLDDLTAWDASLYSDDLLSAETKEQMFTPALESYGFGWRIDRYGGFRRYHHSGSTSGFRNFMQRFPEERLTVIVLTNRAGPDVAPLGEAVADLYLPKR